MRVLATCAGLAAAVPASSAQPSQEFVAYRAVSPATPEAQAALLKNAEKAGLQPVEDSALHRAGLWVFQVKDAALAARNAALFGDMERVPVQEFQGVLSVPTGNYYLRFAGDVRTATARKRVEALGFTILTPEADDGVLVVQGTGRPTDRQRELKRLKQLEHVLYVAPDDIPLRVTARDRLP